MSYAAFEAEVARVNDILCSINVLTWDSRTMMPAAGVESRGRQIATLTALARDLATGEAMRETMEKARRDLDDVGPDDVHLRALDDAAASIGVLARVPADLLGEAADLKTRAQAAWMRARADNDFAAFAPYLERTIEIQRAVAEAVGYSEHPYDAMIGAYEPGMTWSKLGTLYGQLKDALTPLLEAARNQKPARTDILERVYPVERQKAFSRMMAERMGYDFSRGRLDDTVHPFEISFTRSDVRITGRFRETWLPGGLFAVWHEAGHGMYEQSIASEFTRSVFATDFVNLYAVGGASFAMHESQSRLWENRVARSQQFWALHYDELRAVFPEQLADVSGTEFWRAVNAPRPNFVRVEADELTYDFHIILRSEIEAGLMAGDVEVSDLRDLWAERMKSTLGLDVPTDTLGVLQDVHWSSGMIGSFPTYTLGNIMASQLFAAAKSVPAVADGLAAGDYQPLKSWLGDAVHRHGRSLTPNEILTRATGQGLSVDAYIADLTEKVENLEA